MRHSFILLHFGGCSGTLVLLKEEFLKSCELLFKHKSVLQIVHYLSPLKIPLFIHRLLGISQHFVCVFCCKINGNVYLQNIYSCCLLNFLSQNKDLF